MQVFKQNFHMLTYKLILENNADIKQSQLILHCGCHRLLSLPLAFNLEAFTLIDTHYSDWHKFGNLNLGQILLKTLIINSSYISKKWMCNFKEILSSNFNGHTIYITCFIKYWFRVKHYSKHKWASYQIVG